jgi:hypothetical protein
MDLLNQINSELKRGFSKSELERLIGLPKNSLSGVLLGGKKLSKKSELKVQRFMTSEKPNPLDLEKSQRSNKLVNAARGRDENGVNNDELPQKEAQGKPKTKKMIVGSQKKGKSKNKPVNAVKPDLGFNPEHYPDRKKGEGLLEYRIRMTETKK